MNDTSRLLEVRNVAKQFTSGGGVLSVLRSIDLDLAAGESVAIVGPSGSGKSTLLNVLGALDQPDAGHVTLEGRDLAGMDADELATVRNARIGFVFQSHHLLPQCSALENVLIPTLATHRVSPRDAADRAARLLDRVGLGDRVDHRPGQLSGGECQRVAVVRALINEPALVLADEPTGSLDAATADELAALLAELNAEHSTALIVVTHAPRLADRMDRLLELRDGVLTPAGDSE